MTRWKRWTAGVLVPSMLATSGFGAYIYLANKRLLDRRY